MDTKLSLMSNYPVKNFVNRVFLDEHQGNLNTYGKFCQTRYNGRQFADCGFNLAIALAQVKPFLEEHLSEHPRDW